MHTTQTQVVLAVQREVTEQVSGPDSDGGRGGLKDKTVHSPLHLAAIHSPQDPD